MPMTLLRIEDASFLLTTVVMAAVSAVEMKPWIMKSKVTLLVFVVDGRSQHEREFQVLSNVDSSTERVVLMRFKQAFLVS